MLRAYIDDSGNDGESPAFVLAGYISTAEHWTLFSDEWQQALDMSPKIDAFKMSEAFGRAWDSEAQEWRDGKFTEKMRLLFRIIEAHVDACIAVSFSWDGFRKARDMFSVSGTASSTPYAIAFARIIHELGARREEFGLTGKIDFIFDKQSERRAIRANWDALQDAFNFSDIVNSEPQFLDDHAVKPLQAADLLAWWIRRRHFEKLTGGKPIPVPWKVSRQIPGLEIYWDETAVLEWFWHRFAYGGPLTGHFGGIGF
jgi:hypothetical protein